MNWLIDNGGLISLGFSIIVLIGTIIVTVLT